MSIFKRGKIYWYHFVFEGQHIQASTKQGNPRVARQIEAAHRTRLAKGEVGIIRRAPAPALKDFAQRFIDAIQVRCAAKPRTIEYYGEKLKRLLEYPAIADARIDEVDEALIEDYVQHRIAQVSPASVNRELATLKRALRLAQEWRVLNRVPRIRMLSGEVPRDFVLSYDQETAYLGEAPQPLHDVALLILDTGLRIGEALALLWTDLKLEPVKGARFGALRVREGKSRNAKRVLCLSQRVQEMLAARKPTSEWVFPGKDPKAPILVSSLDHQHVRLRRRLNLPADFVLHSLRHTILTRLGETGVDAFTLIKIAGHSSVIVSQRYVYPSSEAMERAFERLEAQNSEAREREKRQLPATFPATS